MKYSYLKLPPELISIISAYARPRNDKLIITINYLSGCALSEKQSFSDFIFRYKIRTHKYNIAIKVCSSLHKKGKKPSKSLINMIKINKNSYIRFF